MQLKNKHKYITQHGFFFLVFFTACGANNPLTVPSEKRYNLHIKGCLQDDTKLQARLASTIEYTDWISAEG